MATHMTKATDLFGARVTLGYVCEMAKYLARFSKTFLCAGHSDEGFRPAPSIFNGSRFNLALPQGNE
jgi:hypothetical protein